VVQYWETYSIIGDWEVVFLFILFFIDIMRSKVGEEENKHLLIYIFDIEK
jgi:hypothetical protein